MRRPAEPVFLARQSYRRRRLEDAARFLPVLGLVLLFLPILWSPDAGTRGGLIYVFSVWAILILLVAPISARLSARAQDPDDETLTEATPKGDGGD